MGKGIIQRALMARGRGTPDADDGHVSQPLEEQSARARRGGATGDPGPIAVVPADIPIEEDWKRYFDLFNFAPVAYTRLNPYGVVEEINQAGCRMLGLPSSKLIGHPLIVHVVKDDRAPFLEHMRRSRNEDVIVETELSLQARDGDIVPVRAYSKRSTLQGRVVCWTVLADLTEYTRLEQARRQADEERQRAEREQYLAQARSDAKDNFLAVLSHELRTPLAPALFAAARLVDAELPVPVRSLANVIKRSIELEVRLIDDLLDVTRINRGRVTLDLDMLDAHPVILEAVEICWANAQASGVKIVTDLRARDSSVRGDVNRLRQVFWNLVTNGIKFSSGGGTIHVQTINDESGWLRVSVTDTGIGMDAEVLDRLFQPFEQAPSSRSGLGLGLAICKGIVEAHGGGIWASSAGRGRGSRIEIELPAVVDHPAARPAETGEGQPELRQLGPLKILLVEDDEATSKLLSMLLREDGHDVTVRSTLHDALAEIGKPWDVVVSDLGLPDGTGLELARRMAGKEWTRMIAVSGYGAERDVRASQEAGFDDHLVKPVDFEVLRLSLRQSTAPVRRRDVG
jgi:PAS domain S-box-containing protein